MFNCDSAISPWIVVLTVIALILALTIIRMSYTFIIGYMRLTKEQKQAKQSFFFICVPFLIVSFIALPMQIPYIIYRECYQNYANIFAAFLLTTNASQLYLMQIIWFIRLYFSFKDSVLKLSKCIVRFYSVIFIILGILFIPTVIGYNFMEFSKYSALFAVFSSINILMAISFCILFVIKLMRAYRNLSNEESFLSIINRITILTILCVFITIISIIVTTARINYPQSDYLRFTAFYMVTIHQYTNVLSVMLSLTYFNKVYNVLLGFMDSRCKKCWFKMASIETEKKLVELQKIDDMKTTKSKERSIGTIETSNNISSV